MQNKRKISVNGRVYRILKSSSTKSRSRELTFHVWNGPICPWSLVYTGRLVNMSSKYRMPFHPWDFFSISMPGFTLPHRRRWELNTIMSTCGPFPTGEFDSGITGPRARTQGELTDRAFNPAWIAAPSTRNPLLQDFPEDCLMKCFPFPRGNSREGGRLPSGHPHCHHVRVLQPVLM